MRKADELRRQWHAENAEPAREHARRIAASIDDLSAIADAAAARDGVLTRKEKRLARAIVHRLDSSAAVLVQRRRLMRQLQEMETTT